LTLVAGAAVASAAEPQEDESKAALEKQLQKLLHERVATAELAVVAMQAAYEAQTVALFDFLDGANKLVEARLAVAATREQEIDALEKHLKLMQTIEQNLKALYDLGSRGGEAKEYAAAQRERQSAQIALIKARLKAEP
jgi:hypothetical protein